MKPQKKKKLIEKCVTQMQSDKFCAYSKFGILGVTFNLATELG